MVVPKHIGSEPYHLELSDIVGATAVKQIEKSKHMVFHAGGDCGSPDSVIAEHIIARYMERDFLNQDPSNEPQFLYLLGDVVYPYGAAREYYRQFYKPFEHYPAPIFAIPGNHDGDIDRSLDQPPPSLQGWMRNFCMKKPAISRDAGSVDRDGMTQPGPYWTLKTPFARFIGLYSNVPEGGDIRSPQTDWFVEELARAKDNHIPAIVCLHHSPYSADDHHKGSKGMAEFLDDSFAKAGIHPLAVLSAHVHNYQRFTRRVKSLDDGSKKLEIPYLVAGASGHWDLHSMARHGAQIDVPTVMSDDKNLTLESYADDHNGYLLLDLSPDKLKIKYLITPRTHESLKKPAKTVDQCKLDLKTRKIK